MARCHAKVYLQFLVVDRPSHKSRSRLTTVYCYSFGLGPPESEGAIFRSDPSLKLQTVKTPVAVPNGIAFSPDNKTAYITETRQATIYSYAFDVETGTISNEQVFIKFTPEVYGPGSPDGLAIGEDGDLWVAMFAAYRVLRIDAKTKEVKGSIEVPGSKQVACPRFIGEGLLVRSFSCSFVY